TPCSYSCTYSTRQLAPPRRLPRTRTRARARARPGKVAPPRRLPRARARARARPGNAALPRRLPRSSHPHHRPPRIPGHAPVPPPLHLVPGRRDALHGRAGVLDRGHEHLPLEEPRVVRALGLGARRPDVQPEVMVVSAGG